MTMLAEAGSAMAVDAVDDADSTSATPPDALESRAVLLPDAGVTFIDSASTVVASAAPARGVIEHAITTAAAMAKTAVEASAARTPNMATPSSVRGRRFSQHSLCSQKAQCS